jgi:uncharacterized protein
VNRVQRVVLDTNVVLSALLFGGSSAAELRYAWQRGLLQPLLSTATAQELVRVLTYPKFRLSTDEQLELLADYLPHAVAVRMPKKLPSVPACRDPFDLPFLHLALVGRAQALISGDKDLLSLADEFPVPILAPAEFLSLFSRA